MTAKKVPEPTKFCKDCKFVSIIITGSWFCRSDQRDRNIVDGECDPLYCSESRSSEIKCGPTAKWFEEKDMPIPKCIECSKIYMGHCRGGYREHPLTGVWYYPIAYDIERGRSDESLCGKYGKWFEEKEIFPVSYIEYTTKAMERLAEQPKKQSWLSRLIFGRRK